MGQLTSEGWALPRQTGSGGVARWIGGAVAAVATLAVLVLAAVLTVVFAATLAVMLVLSSALIGVYALAHRARRQPAAQGARVIEARRVGHSWVAYGWDQRPR